mmetsp:Transcript_124151/g.247366  ORF Transcript_124151/g.247366 Transcript_124151/m.247366 type:complete len:240 (-) Transcript_124151:204-923(-)
MPVLALHDPKSRVWMQGGQPPRVVGQFCHIGHTRQRQRLCQCCSGPCKGCGRMAQMSSHGCNTQQSNCPHSKGCGGKVFPRLATESNTASASLSDPGLQDQTVEPSVFLYKVSAEGQHDVQALAEVGSMMLSLAWAFLTKAALHLLESGPGYLQVAVATSAHRQTIWAKQRLRAICLAGSGHCGSLTVAGPPLPPAGAQFLAQSAWWPPVLSPQVLQETALATAMSLQTAPGRQLHPMM